MRPASPSPFPSRSPSPEDRGEAGELVAVPAPAPAPQPLAEVAADIAELDVDTPRVAIIVADRADLEVLGVTEHELARREIRSETRVMSADEAAPAIADYTENARMRGIRVIVAGTGPAARLAAMVTVHTRLPVIGVPLRSQGAAPGRLDALLAQPAEEAQAPIAWVGLDDALAAAALAARILDA